MSSGAIFDLYSSVILKYYRVEIVFIFRHETINRKVNIDGTIFDIFRFEMLPGSGNPSKIDQNIYFNIIT